MDTISDNEAMAPAPVSKKITSRRRAIARAPMNPGNHDVAGSFIKIEGPEGMIAAYCGIHDIGRFRRFYTSPLVMPYYLKSLAYHGYRRRIVLSLLRDKPEDYWTSDEDPQKEYPLDDAANKNYCMGLNLSQMLRGLRKGLSADTPTLDKASFTKLTDRQLPTTSRPLSADEVPSFGPFAQESKLEAINRCLCLFAHIKYTLYKSQWNKRFFGKIPWDAAVQVTVEYQPDWMRTPDESSGPPPDEPIFITVAWKQDSKNKTNRAYVEEMMERGELEHVPMDAVVKILPSMIGPEVRDRIREAFKMHKYDGELEQLTLHHSGGYVPALSTPWDKILELLQTHQDATFTCLIKLREDGYLPREYGKPPAELREGRVEGKDDGDGQEEDVSDFEGFSDTGEENADDVMMNTA